MYVIDDYNEVEKVEKCPPSESSPLERNDTNKMEISQTMV